jgi:hypothetical protein
MRLALIIICAVTTVTTACKLEASSGTQNVNTNGNQANVSTRVSTQDTQTNCSLTMTAAPVLEGLKLGMTTDEVLATLPGSKDDPDVRTQLARPRSPLGVSDLGIHVDKLQPKEKFSGINHLSFILLDGRVSTINIGYNGPAYPHVDQFVSKFVRGTNLPPVDQWQAYVGMDNQLKILTCKDFEVRVFAGGKGGNLNYVLAKDLEAEKKLREREKKAEEKASPTP